ncbi:MAG: ROK family protein [Saprospiraceae bacterium]
MNSDICWGIDMGGTKIEGAVFRKSPKLEILARIRLNTEQELGYQHILNQFIKLVNLLKEASGLIPEKIGIGTPGTIDSVTKTIKNSNTQCIIGKPMKDDLESLLKVKIIMANDANCFAFAETILGAVPEIIVNPEVVFGIIMGTGVGGGIVIDHKIINGLHGIAGEWGHNPLADTGDTCYCGKIACVETFISGPATEKYYKSISGIALKTTDIYSKYLEGDQFAVMTINRLIQYFGKAVAQIINILDPDIIVIGGGLSHLDVLFTLGRNEVKKHLFNKEFNTKFIKPKLGDSAGVIGAGLL